MTLGSFFCFSSLLPAGADLSLQLVQLYPSRARLAVVLQQIAVNYQLLGVSPSPTQPIKLPGRDTAPQHGKANGRGFQLKGDLTQSAPSMSLGPPMGPERICPTRQGHEGIDPSQLPPSSSQLQHPWVGKVPCSVLGA